MEEGVDQERETWALPGVAVSVWGGVEVVALIVSVTEKDWGELEALGSDMVAVVLVAPTAMPAGFTMKETLVLAPPASELDAGLNVSQGLVLVADQLRVLLAGPVFVMTTGWDDVAVP